MAEFKHFSKIIAERFDALSENELFVVDISKDDLWDRYIEAFPEGANPIYRVNTVHECSCCRHALKNIGNVVAIINNQIETVWDFDGLEEPYATVAKAMHDLVSAGEIRSVFRTKEGRFGAETTIELLEGNQTKKWNHFYCDIDRKHLSSEPDATRGRIGSLAHVFRRGLTEFKIDALDEVIDLIGQGALYRGDEHLRVVQYFRELKLKFDESKRPDLFVWENIISPFAGIKNSVIGTLLDDLSQGVELERAVKSFETKVAPTNYKRPKALITPKMIESAMETIDGLGLRPALERRHARVEDIAVSDVLFVDNDTQAHMKGGVEGLLMEAVKDNRELSKQPIEIDMADFVSDVVPVANSIDLYVENHHTGNLASLTAPVKENAKHLFKWDNNFAWSYNGEVADSIKERVKRAGGNTDAQLRVSLAWHNADDLDLHCHVKKTGEHIFFGHKAGILDVDMNAGGNYNRVDPVENMQWKGIADGRYHFEVNQYTKRENENFGFEIEIENKSQITNLIFDRAVTGTVGRFSLDVLGGKISQLTVTDTHLEASSASKDIWGIKTNSFVRGKILTLSPNHWGENETGNKHWFFVLEGCKNPDPVRGIFNEFLSPELAEHRKVFEVLGAKTKCAFDDNQVSGIGFSSTVRETVQVLVATDKGNKQYKINF